MKKSLHSFIHLLFGALFLLLPLVFTSINDELFEFNKMLVVYLVAILMATSWVSLCILERKIIWKKTPLDLPILVFVGSQVISSIFSINLHTSLFGYYSRFNGGLFSVLAYVFLFYMFVIFVDRSKIRAYVWFIIWGGILSSLYALPEHFGYSPSCLIFTGKFDVACWVQDVKSRVFGTFGQPNWLAAYLGLILPLAIVDLPGDLWQKTHRTLTDHLPKILGRLAIVCLFISVVFFTGSRSGLLGIGVGYGILGLLLMAVLIKSHIDIKLQEVKERAKIVFGFFAFACLLLIIIMLSVPNPVREKIARLIPQEQTLTTSPSPKAQAPVSGTQLEIGGSESGKIREVVWQGAVRVWKRYPLFGSGVETFAYSYYKDRLTEHNLLSEWDFLYNKAHNEFLNYLATTGLVGLLSYVFMLGSFILHPLWIICNRLRSHASHTHENQTSIYYLIAISTGLVILSISNFFGFSTVMVSCLTFIFAGIVVVIRDEGQTKNEVLSLKLENPTQADWITIGIVFLLSLLPLLYIRKLWIADIVYARGKQLNNAGQYEPAYAQLKKATQMVPEEPIFHDEFSSNLASIAVILAKQGDATASGTFAAHAISESDTTISQNGVHTNFWKTRIKVFLTLSQLNQELYKVVIKTLDTTHDLTPTDPKIVYYQALLAQTQNDLPGYERFLLQAIELKPNYEEARNALAKHYETQGKPNLALEQYQYMVKFINPENQNAHDKIASLSATKK